MPLYQYVCPQCGESVRVMQTVEQQRDGKDCPVCDTGMERKLNAPSTRTVEVIDTGLMGKRLERLADAERIYKEHVKTVEKDKP